MVILDATAGNRMIWPNKNPPFTVFIDKELGLARPPDIFADNRFCPFRDDIFDCVIYDPPYSITLPPWMLNKGIRTDSHGGIGSYYGVFKSRVDMFSSINQAQKEFARISKRLCFKWNEMKVSLWSILPFFKCWMELYRMENPILLRKGKRQGESETWWVTFILSESN